MKVYVASSWRCARHPAVVVTLKEAGYEVYDFRNPAEGNTGFSWREIAPNWQGWSPREFREALEHPVARDGYLRDRVALDTADACVLVLPCGRSAHLELGYAIGRRKATAVLILDQCEPELMYSMVDSVCVSMGELLSFLADRKHVRMAGDGGALL